MSEVKVRYGQTVKVTNPADRYENSTFSLSVEVTRPFSDPPEGGEEEFAQWERARSLLIEEEVATLREQTEEEIQKDVDQFIADNTPGAN